MEVEKEFAKHITQQTQWGALPPHIKEYLGNSQVSFLFFCFVLFCFVLFCFVLFCCVLLCFVFCFVLFCFVFFL